MVQQNLGKKNVSKEIACDVAKQHKTGMKYFVLAFIFLIASLIVGLAEQIFALDPYLWLGWSIFYLIGLIISVGFFITLILGLISYFKCNVKEVMSD